MGTRASHFSLKSSFFFMKKNSSLRTKRSPKNETMGRAKKDPNAPKRPQTAFFLFAADHRAEAKKTLPEGSRVSEVAKKLGVMWKEVDAKTKEKYQSQAEENKAKYAEEMEAYRNSQEVTANDSE